MACCSKDENGEFSALNVDFGKDRAEREKWERLLRAAESLGCRRLQRNGNLSCDEDLLAEIGAAVGACRVTLLRYEVGSARHVTEVEWRETGVNPLLEPGVSLSDHSFPEITRSLFSGKIYGSLIEQKTGENYYLNAAARTQSDLIAPIFADGHYWGCLSLDDTKHGRIWAWEEVSMVRRLADVLGENLPGWLRRNVRPRLVLRSRDAVFVEGLRLILDADFDFVEDVGLQPAAQIVEVGEEFTPEQLCDLGDEPILAVASASGASFFHRCVRAGARAFLTRNATPDDYRQAIARVIAGRTWFAPEVRGWLDFGSSRRVLSAREREVLLAVAKGHSNKEAAAELGLSPASVDTYLRRIFAKLGARSRQEAIYQAVRNGELNGRGV